jgi:S1-C subfamily serine protease
VSIGGTLARDGGASVAGWPPVNVVDLVLLAALLWAALRGWRQGALSQVAAFGGAAVGLVVGALAAPRLAAEFVGQPGATLALLTLGILLGIIFIAQAIGLAIGLRLRRAAHAVGAGPVDRTAGIAVGVASVVVTVWLLGSVLVQGPSPALAQQVRESEIVMAVDRALPPAPDLFSRVGTYLDRQGFPQVFTGLGGGTLAPPVPPPEQGAVAAAAAAGQASTVQVQATGCGGISSGSGFVVSPGFVVTNAHVVAGGDVVVVRDPAGEHDAVPVHFDPELDLAVLAAPDLAAPPIPFVATPAERGTAGATLGFPGGARTLTVEPAVVRGRGTALGRDIYGQDLVNREILTLAADVDQGDSGGPFVTVDGRVGGVVFAAAAADPGVGYALTAAQVQPGIAEAMARNTPVPTGQCRF